MCTSYNTRLSRRWEETDSTAVVYGLHGRAVTTSATLSKSRVCQLGVVCWGRRSLWPVAPCCIVGGSLPSRWGIEGRSSTWHTGCWRWTCPTESRRGTKVQACQKQTQKHMEDIKNTYLVPSTHMLGNSTCKNTYSSCAKRNTYSRNTTDWISNHLESKGKCARARATHDHIHNINRFVCTRVELQYVWYRYVILV